MAEIDQEEIPPSLQKELEWLEETKKRRKSRDPDEFSISSKRSSIISISTEGRTYLLIVNSLVYCNHYAIPIVKDLRLT